MESRINLNFTPSIDLKVTNGILTKTQKACREVHMNRNASRKLKNLVKKVPCYLTHEKMDDGAVPFRGENFLTCFVISMCSV